MGLHAVAYKDLTILEELIEEEKVVEQETEE